MNTILSPMDLTYITNNKDRISCRKMAKLFNMTYSSFRHKCYVNNILFSVCKNNGRSDLFSPIASASISYFLGFLWADGYIKNKNSAIETEILSNDANEIKNWIDIRIKYKEYRRHRKDRETTVITIGDTQLVNTLVNKFSFDQKNQSFMKLDYIPKCFIKYFLRGYLDGDGYIAKSKIQFSAPYEYDWASFISFLSSLDINTYKIRKYISVKNHKSSSMIINLKHNSEKLLSFIYDGYDQDHIGLTRKYQKYLDYYKN